MINTSKVKQRRDVKQLVFRMTRHLHIAERKRHPQVLYPDQLGERVDLVDLLAAEWAQEDRAIASHRSTRLSARAVFHRLGHTASVAIARAISGDCFFLITGAMVALDLVLVIWLVRR